MEANRELTDFELRAKDVVDRNFWEGMRPDPILTVSEWADEHRQLSAVSSAESGKWRTSRTPYLREIMDCLSAMNPVQEVVFMKGAQIGGTEAGNNWIGYVIDHVPGPMMAVQPTVDTAKRNSKTRIKPLIEESPRLKRKVKSSRSRDGGNTVMSKEFPGGILVLAGANSAVALRSMPVRYLMLDEIDGYPDDVDGEGDPVGLAEARTRTFLRRKIYKVSTPTFEGRSKIQVAFEESDQRRYHVPCPHCKAKQWLKWSRIEWPEGEPLKAFYRCEHCQEPIYEHHKAWMLINGEWIADKPGIGNGKVVGFHLSALYSPFGSYTWGDAARQWIKAQGNQERLREFVNTVLGETWKEKGEAPDWNILYQRREPYPIGSLHESIVFLTAGVDVQKDRIEVEVVGWARNKESWSVEYFVFSGDTAKTETWEPVDELLSRTWQKVCGAQLPIRMMFVDSAYNTQHVYNWVRRHPVTRVRASRGVDNLQMPVGNPTKVDINLGGKKIKRGMQLWPVGVSVLKGELYSWLQVHPPTDEELKEGKSYPYGYCHFPEYQDEYFKQLTAEQLVCRIKKNRRKYEWDKTRERNEALDCRIYARAAAFAVGMDRFTEQQWLNLAGTAGIVMSKSAAVVQKPSPSQPRRRSSFLAGRD